MACAALPSAVSLLSMLASAAIRLVYQLTELSSHAGSPSPQRPIGS